MIKFKCELCNQTFANGTTFVGHINSAHHATSRSLPPPKPIHKHQFGRDSAESSSSSSHSPCAEQRENKKIKNVEVEVKPLVYGLRANPKKSIKFADPDFSSATDTGSIHLQENESQNDTKNPPPSRSKRARKSSFGDNSFELPAAGPSSEVMQAATALMIISRTVKRRKDEVEDGKRSVEFQLTQNNVKFQCQKCNKKFQSSRALAGHKKSCPAKGLQARNSDKRSIFECPFCFKVFGSGQALGGHKRSHLVNSPRTDSSSAATENSAKRGSNLIDLNLPARSDDDELSAVCDA